MSAAPGLILNDGLRGRMLANLARFERRAHDDRSLTPAAVALLLVANDAGEACFVITRRAARMKDHAGQWALPGGRLDPGEDAVTAALRESHEEVGARCSEGDVLGLLDDYPTRSGFVISPFEVWGGRDVNLVANPAEVEMIHRVPLRELLREDLPLLDSIDESPHPVLRMPLGDDWFAAPSAAIAYQFREVALLGRCTRVAHFEQPYFAWQ